MIEQPKRATIPNILGSVEHRPYPLATAPWVMFQSWHDLLFAHWPIPGEMLRSVVPPCFELDDYNGEFYVGVVPFWMSNVRARYAPALPALSRFPELNVRTYVRANGKPGVYFFSLDASNALAVSAARAFYHLPYFHARMSCNVSEGDRVEYRSARIHPDSHAAELKMRYWPVASPASSPRGSLEAFLTERYCLYGVDRREQVYCVEIHHLPWPLQLAHAEFELNTMAAAAGISLPDVAPLLHFSKRQDVLIWAPVPCPCGVKVAF